MTEKPNASVLPAEASDWRALAGHLARTATMEPKVTDVNAELATFATQHDHGGVPRSWRDCPRIRAAGFDEARAIAATLSIDGAPVFVIGQICDGIVMREPSPAAPACPCGVPDCRRLPRAAIAIA